MNFCAKSYKSEAIGSAIGEFLCHQFLHSLVPSVSLAELHFACVLSFPLNLSSAATNEGVGHSKKEQFVHHILLPAQIPILSGVISQLPVSDASGQ